MAVTDPITDQVVRLATAARAAGVLHLRLRKGPVAEMQLLPADPPPLGEDDKNDTEETRRQRLFSERGPL